MVIDLKSFLSKEEEQQISQILERAEKRLQKQYRQQPDTLLYLDCQCRADEQIQEERENLGSSCMADMQGFLMMVCQFCKEHGCCQCWDKGEEEREEGEELPF